MKSPHPSYAIITGFYETWSLPYARRLLGSSLRKAQQRKQWKKEPPATLVHFYERLEELLWASRELAKEKEKFAQSYKRKGDEDFTQSAQRSSGAREENRAMNHELLTAPSHPRYLSPKEYRDPWKMLQKIHRYKTLKEWKELLKGMLYHALSPYIYNYGITGEEVLESWLLLHGLLEAMWLIGGKMSG